MDKVLFDIALKTIQKYDMLNEEDTVIVACSGGADSMALIFFLLMCKDLLNITVEAAHINHGMRGEYSDNDEKFVREFCAQNNVPCHFTRLYPQNDYSEEWARKNRYAFLDKLASEKNAKIATAHTASDNAETVLFNLARGSSSTGAGGIPSVRGAYIRPFLEMERADTEKICQDAGIDFVVDKTNLTCEYSRGIIRNKVLPLLENAHACAARNIAKFAKRQAQISEYLSLQARQALDSAQIKDGAERYTLSQVYDARALQNIHPVLLCEVAKILVKPCGRTDEKLIERAYDVICGKTAFCELASQYTLCKTANLVYLDKAIAGQELKVTLLPGKYQVLEGFWLEISILSKKSYENLVKVQKKDLIFCADYDRIENIACFRQRKIGDKFTFRGKKLTKSVKKIMQEAGFACSARDFLPLLVSDERVLWMPQCGFCEGTQPLANTKNIIYITLKRDLEEL